MLHFNSIYHPFTSRPYLSKPVYREYIPCRLLSPYIACYWTASGEDGAVAGTGDVLVIPDTCMDIIIRINHTRQSIEGIFCGMQDRPYIRIRNNCREHITSFAIRFYFWSAGLFLKMNFQETCNGTVGLEGLGREWEDVFKDFLYIVDVRDRIELVEDFLLKKWMDIELDSNLFNCMERMLTMPGRMPMKDICAYGGISQRQMERLFLRQIGLPPKRVMNLVRYQKVWQDMAMAPAGLNIQDTVYRYGYTDQAHLLKEFRRFHGVSPQEARKIASRNR